ncbi:MAG: lysylphosphatidylglycerol synthase transmembrane domain-containing protein [Anaerolineae bacterium]
MRTLASFGIALVMLYFLATRVDIDFREVWANMQQANPLLYAAAIVVYYSSFAARGYRWRRLLHNAEVDWDSIPRVRDLVEIIYLSWFANSIVPAKLGDLYRGYLLKKDSGISFSLSMGTIVAERLLDFVVLVTLMGVAGLISFRGRLPQQIIQLLAGAFAIVVAVIIGLLFLQRFSDAIGRRLPDRAGDLYTRFSAAMLLSFQRFPELLAYTVTAWACESARVWFVILALGVSLPVSMVIFLGLLAALLTTLPLTPGGLGFAEAGLTGVLILYGVNQEMAGSIALLDRTISFLSLLIGGSVVYLLSKKTK